MARKSLAALATPMPLGKKRPNPPVDLPESSRALWCEICNSLPAGYFAPGDLPLLTAYVLAQHQKAGADALVGRDGLVIGDRANPALKLSMQLASVSAALAGKLRLCPSSRTRPDAAGLTKSLSAMRPWEASPGSSKYFADDLIPGSDQLSQQ